jgi:dipeptidyl aminopeptidase/acylaminoacyl peptidase
MLLRLAILGAAFLVAAIPKAVIAITVADQVSMTTLGDPSYVKGGSAQGSTATYSPDGSRFAIVTRRGDLVRMVNVYDLRVYKKVDVHNGHMEPQRKLSFISGSNDPGVAKLSWSLDSRKLTFVGAVDDILQVMQLDDDTGSVQVLTQSATSVIGYSLCRSAERILYIARAPWRGMWDDPNARRDGYRVAGTEILSNLIAGRAGYFLRGLEEETDLFYQDATGSRKVVLPQHLARQFSTPALSPDCQYAIVNVQLGRDEVPQSWKRYTDLYTVLAFRTLNRPGYVQSEFQQWRLVDLQSGESRFLLDAPSDPMGALPIWMESRHSVALRSYRPLGDIKSANDAHEGAVAIEAGIAAPTYSVIDSDCEVPLGWNSAKSQLECKARTKDKMGNVGDIYLHLTRKGWSRVAREPLASFEVVLRQDFKTPPRLFAIDHARRHEGVLLDLNPQLSEFHDERVEEVSWSSPSGRIVKAGLYFPSNFDPMKKYPLMIQTHGWFPDRYEPAGLFGAGFVAQPLAVRGFFVLQVDDLDYDYLTYEPDKELDYAIGIYSSGIALLNSRGYIDPTRVGILGWSHTCFEVKYALTHTELFAAAAIAEGEDGGYLQYVLGLNDYVNIDSLYGGPPYGANLKNWVAKAPGFNLDRVKAPLRIAVLQPQLLLLNWDWFSGLLDLGKPVDMVMFETGDHYLEKPNEKLSIGETNVDWFDFWLNGHEDSDLTKTAQYARWEKLCDLQMANNSGRSTFCLPTKH